MPEAHGNQSYIEIGEKVKIKCLNELSMARSSILKIRKDMDSIDASGVAVAIRDSVKCLTEAVLLVADVLAKK